jgi:DNA-binding XRE family transcriptional regulator
MKKEVFYPCDFDDNEEDIPYWDLDTIFNRHVLICADGLPVHLQIRLKKHHDFLSQTELAKKLGIAPSTLCEIENGTRKIPNKCLPAIESYLYRQYYYGGALTDVFDDLDEQTEVI